MGAGVIAAAVAAEGGMNCRNRLIPIPALAPVVVAAGVVGSVALGFVAVAAIVVKGSNEPIVAGKKV